MKKDSWLFIIMRSLEGVRTLHLERRTVTILILGGIFFAGAMAFFAYEYFSLFYGRKYLLEELKRLQYQVSVLEEKLKKTSAQIPLQKLDSSPLAVEELKVIRRASREGFSVRFRLINQSGQEIAISGTLAMVAKNETLRTPIYRVIPEMRLAKGVPQEPEKGSKFEVRKQKFVEAFFDESADSPFKTLIVYVFSSEGKLILQKSIEIPEE